MEDVLPPEFVPTAAALLWRDAWVFESHLFYRASVRDETGYNAVVKEPLSEEQLGAHVRTALAASRMLSIAEIPLYFGRSVTAPRYERWLEWCLRQTGASSRRALFKELKLCPVTNEGGIIKVVPMRRSGAEGWVGLGEPEAIVRIADTASDAELGAALRLAMSSAVG